MDRDILRVLAGEIAEIAHKDIQVENAKLYRALNRLHPIRPVVLIDELPWNQLNGEGELTLSCEDPFLRTIEEKMRRILYQWRHIPVDMIVEPFFRLPKNIRIGDCGVVRRENTLENDPYNAVVSHRYIDCLPDEEALYKLRVPQIFTDEQADQRQFNQVNDLFGDILPVLHTGYPYGGFFHPWDDFVTWHGVESLMIDLIDRPEFLIGFIQKYLDINRQLLSELETRGLLGANEPLIHCTAGLADELPDRADGTPITRRQIWGRGAAQIFSSVSPAMHEELDIEYEKIFFEGFGLVYYGCCEPLDRKIDIVKKLPNLRKISISPWADPVAAAEKIGAQYVLSRKPNPAYVAVKQIDERVIRKDLLDTLNACARVGTPVEFVLKDISSVCYRPENLEIWARIAMETIRNA